MKKILLFILFLAFFNFSFGADNNDELQDCEYIGKIRECLENQDKVRTITDFVCIEAGTGEVVFQIVLDEKFKEIDEKIESYLLALEKKKDYYFGAEKQEPFTNGVNEIEYYLGEGGEFEKEYKKLCDGEILSEASKCFKNGIPNQLAGGFLKKDNGKYSCELLYKTTLLNYRQTAYLILKENKAQIMKDEHKKFTQKQRTKFDELLDLIIVNLGYLDRLVAKWRSKTKNPYN